MKLGLIILTILLILGCKARNTRKGSNAFVKNVYGQIIKHDRYPVKFYIHNSANEEEISDIMQVMNYIEIKANKKLFDYRGLTDLPDIMNNIDHANVIYIRKIWESDRASEQGRSSIYWADDEIQETDIRINAKNFSLSHTPEDLTSSSVDFKSLMLHELLHSLGLKHSDIPHSIMNTHLPLGVIRMELSLNELEGLSLL